MISFIPHWDFSTLIQIIFLLSLAQGYPLAFKAVPWQVCSLKRSSQPAVGPITVAPRPFPGFPGPGDGPARLAPCRGLSGQLTIGAKWWSIFYHAEGWAVRMLFTPTPTFSARLQELSEPFKGGRSQEHRTGTMLTRPSPGCLLGNHVTCCEAWERALPLEAGLLAPKPLLSTQDGYLDLSSFQTVYASNITFPLHYF